MGYKYGAVKIQYCSTHTITIFQNWYCVEMGTRQYCVTDISLFSCISLSLLNPLPISLIPTPPSGGRYLIQNVPVIKNWDDIVQGDGPGRRRG